MSQQRKRPKKVKVVEIPPEPKTQLINHLKPKTKNQAEYIRKIVENDVTFCSGPAGSGKSHVALGCACEWLASGKIDKIIITRPVVETGQKMGFLPGGINEKFEPHVQAAMDELLKFYDARTLGLLLHEKKIELIPLAYMRGRTLAHAFILLEEAQNTTNDEIKMFLSRIGENSKMVISGDVKQSDLKVHERGAFAYCFQHLKDISGIDFAEMTNVDIQRHRLIGVMMDRLEGI